MFWIPFFFANLNLEVLVLWDTNGQKTWESWGSHRRWRLSSSVLSWLCDNVQSQSARWAGCGGYLADLSYAQSSYKVLLSRCWWFVSTKLSTIAWSTSATRLGEKPNQPNRQKLRVSNRHMAQCIPKFTQFNLHRFWRFWTHCRYCLQFCPICWSKLQACIVTQQMHFVSIFKWFTLRNMMKYVVTTLLLVTRSP